MWTLVESERLESCWFKRGPEDGVKVDGCMNAEYWSEDKLDGTSGHTKKVLRTGPERVDFDSFCKGIGDVTFEEGDDSCLSESINRLKTDTKPVQDGDKIVFNENGENADVNEVELVHDIILHPVDRWRYFNLFELSIINLEFNLEKGCKEGLTGFQGLVLLRIT